MTSLAIYLHSLAHLSIPMEGLYHHLCISRSNVKEFLPNMCQAEDLSTKHARLHVPKICSYNATHWLATSTTFGKASAQGAIGTTLNILQEVSASSFCFSGLTAGMKSLAFAARLLDEGPTTKMRGLQSEQHLDFFSLLLEAI